MADFILHLDIVFSDKGTVEVLRGGWSLRRSFASTPGASSKTGPVTLQEAVDAITSAVTTGALEPLDGTPCAARAQFASGSGPKAPANKPDGRSLAEKIAAQGWLAQELAEALIQQAGVARVRDVSNWIARKIANGETVAHPGSLLTQVANRPQ